MIVWFSRTFLSTHSRVRRVEFAQPKFQLVSSSSSCLQHWIFPISKYVTWLLSWTQDANCQPELHPYANVRTWYVTSQSLEHFTTSYEYQAAPLTYMDSGIFTRGRIEKTRWGDHPNLRKTRSSHYHVKCESIILNLWGLGSSTLWIIRNHEGRSVSF